MLYDLSDESNNCVKFRFKDIKGNTNVKWYNDFVLSGIAFEGDSDPIRIEDLFVNLNFKKYYGCKAKAYRKV